MMGYFRLVVLFLVPSLLHSQYSWVNQFPALPSFTNPIEIVHAPDGTNRIFVVQQQGIIYVFQNNPATGVRKIFLNISDRVSQGGGETGLLGLAFHPEYADSGYFYVNYTSSSSGQLRSYVARYRVSSLNPDSAVHNSERILLTVDQPYNNHNGGKLAFGPDGYLYIAFGDGGSANDPGNRAQDPTTLLGKILRINVDSSDTGLNYSIPPTNPFVGNLRGFRDEIYAYGVRNPWKFSFDPLIGTLWLADVGQDSSEEIDTVINGGNYGWRLMEGFICNPTTNPTCQDTAGLLRPVWIYPHNGASASVTGGYIYRGTEIPSLYGKYIFGDYEFGTTWALSIDTMSQVNVSSLSSQTFRMTSFGVDSQGEIYLCTYGSGARLYKLTSSASVAGSSGDISPNGFRLFQNYPNPFNPITTIGYSLDKQGYISLRVYDALGREVAELVNEIKASGTYHAVWNASGFPSGIYFYRFSQNGSMQIKKMILLK